MSRTPSSILQTIFYDKKGKLVIVQAPNVSEAIGWTALFLSGPLSGMLEAFTSVLGFGTLFTWGWLELFEGVNYWRRFLGACMIIGLVVIGVLTTQ